MSFPALSAMRMRFAFLKFCLVVLALVTLLLPSALSAQQTFAGGGAVSLSSSQTTSSSSTLTIAGATGSSIATIKITLTGVTSNGDTGFSLQPTTFLLQAPNGGPSLILLGATGDGTDGDDGQDAGSGLDNVNITIQDGGTAAPDGNSTIWPHTGSVTVAPSSYWSSNVGIEPPLGTAIDWPQTDGTATLDGRFAGTSINDSDKWTLTLNNGDGFTTAVSVSSWSMTVTYATTSPSTTTVSSSLNPALTTSSVTLTATVTGSGAPTGTVAFSNNGTAISGCGASVVSGGHAACTTTMTEGYHVIDAVYSGGGGFGPSSGSLTQLIEVQSTQTGNTWCNNTSFSAALDSTPIAYPAIISVSGYPAGTTVGNVTVELEGVTQGAAGTGIDAEFLLVAPGGLNNLDFLDTAFNTQGSGVNLFISDAATQSPNYGTPVSGDTYLPFDGNTQTIDSFPPSNSPIVDSNIPSVPATINYAAPHGKTNAFTLQQAFSGAPANGDWALYATASNGTDALTVGGWCVSLDVNTGVATTTTLSSSQQDAFAATNVTLSATVVINGTSTPVTTGTVEFKDETTGIVLAASAALNSSGVASVTTSSLAEGDHKIIATYSGTGTYDTSFTTMYQRIDDASAVTAVNSNTWQFCNAGAITIPMGTSGAETPNPSNIFVSNLPGTLNTATLTLKNFSILVGDQLDNTASLVVGPTGAALDFFSNTADGTIGDEALAGNYIFADSAGALVSSGSGNISAGTYRPTSYVGTDNANDVFTADTGGFFTLPGSFGYSASRGTSTFDSEFGSTNANGTWSLYFNSPNANANDTGAANGWCLNLTENLPAVSVGLSSASTFTQGGSGAYTVMVENNGTGGPTGDPTGTNPMTVTDVLNAAFTFASGSGTGWSCTASGQTVTCKNDSAVADNGGAYPDLTINVTVSGTASGVIGNQVSASGAGASSTNSTTDNVTIEVPLVITSASSTTFTVGTAGSFSVTATGTPAPTFSETGVLPTGVTFTSAGVLSGTPAAGTGGTYPLTITASNGVSPNATQSFTLTIGQAPAITSASSATFTAGAAGSFTVTGSGFPAPTFSETGALPSGVTFSSAGILSGTPAAGSGGIYSFTITASNGVGSNATQTFTLTVDQAPAITSAGSTIFTVGTAGTFTATASGFPSPTFSETGILPSGVTMSSSGVLSGTPAAGTGGTYPLTITASNGVSPNATQSFTLTIDQAPAITSASSATFTAGAAGSFTVTGSGFPAPTFSETGAVPSGVTFSGAGLLSGTPAAGSGGIYSITITASNGVGSNATQTFTLTVDQAPAITSASSATFAVGAAGSFTVTASSFPSSTFSETGILPSGVTFTSTGVLSGTPAAGSGGAYPLTITASNGVSPNATQSFTLTIDQAPAITSASSATFTAGAAGSFTVTGSGFPAPTFSETGAVPSGVTFSGAGLLSGTPAAGSGGIYSITITASNGVGSNATQTFTLTVDQAPTFTSANNAAFAVGTSGSFTVTASSYPSATFSETGVLPTGLTLSSAGVLSGTPTGASGNFPITITASNGVGANATQSFTITVNAGPATHLVIPGGPEPFYTAFTFNISAYDAVGNLATGYNGTVAFTSSDPGFVNLGPVTLVNGVGSQTGVLKTAGVDTITATDTSNPSITGTGSFTIQPGAATHFGLSAPSAAYAGSAFNFTVTAYDLFGNVATGYTGTATFTSTDGAASLPSPSVLTGGVGTFPATLNTAGSQTITATDSINGVTGTSGAITVTIPNLVVNAIPDDAGTAANCTVQAAPGINTVDSACSLRDALLEAASIGSGSITFDSTAFAAAQTITLTNGTLTIPPNTTITGPTTGSGSTLTNLITVSGGGTAGVFSHTSGSATISGLIITGGNNANGGGVYNGPGAAFTISNSTISGNSASFGGGLYNWGTMTVDDCTISGNTASQEGGGILTQGSALTVTNSTISGNAARSGGGIINLSGAATLTDTTISHNSATTDGGGVASQASLALTNSIISGNTSSGTNPNVPPGYTDNGGNVVNSSNIDLASLGSYGGPTQTMIPLPGSAAICDINPSVATGDDQRGLPRTTTYGAVTCQDSGAVETSYSMTFSTDPPATVPAGTNFTAGVTLDESGNPFVVTATPQPTVTIPLTLSGTGTLTGGSVAIDDATGIATYSALEVSLTGNNDTLTANLTLNPAVTPTPPVITAISSQFDVELTSTTTTAAGATATYSESAQTVALSATVTSTLGTVNAGNVTFAVFQGATQIGAPVTSGTVANGAANANFVLPVGTPAGTYTIQATYSGTTTLASSSDNTHTIVVSPATTTTAASSVSTAYSTSAQSVTLAATVTSPAGAVNAGTVTFTVLQGVTPVGTAVTSTPVLNGAAGVSYTLPAGTPAAVYSIQAVYNGTVSLSTSSDASHTLAVSQTATTTTAVNAAATYNTSAQNVTLTATVTSTSGPVNAGTVTFTVLQGSTPVGIAVTSTTVVNGAASAIYVLPTGSPAGTYTIQAAYNGTASLSASSDSTHTLTVSKATATVTLGSLTQTYTGSPLSATATTAPTGLTVNFTYNGNPASPTTVGNYTVVGTISNANYQGSATGTLTITQATPTVTWATPAAITYGTALSAIQLDASSTVAGTFAYNPAAGTTLGAGTHTLTVTFTPTDTTDYTTATATVTLLVNQATPAITWANPAAITYGTALSATQLDATSTVAGTFAYSPVAGTVLTTGSHTLSVTLTPTDAVDYTTASATVSLTVNQATPAITWVNPAAITYGTALSATQLDATSTVAGTFAYNPTAGTVLTAGSHTLSVTLTPTDTTDYTTSTASVTITVNQATPAITWVNPAAITYGTALSATQLDATSTVAGTFAYNPTAGTVLTAGSHTLSVTLTPTDSTDYTTATGSVTITVNQAAPVIVWLTPLPIVYGTALGAAQLDATSTVAGAFVYNPAPGTVLTAGSHTLSVTFTPTDTADYTSATASVAITINQATPQIVWPAPASITYGTALSATQLDASSTAAGTFVYNPAAGTVLTAGSHALSVTFTPTDTSDYTNATASVTLLVNNEPQTITLSAGTLADAAGVPFGPTPFTLSATATSGLTVVFTLVSGPATLNGNSLTINGAGTVVIAANQSGNSNYAAAPQVTESIPVNQALPATAIASSVNPVLVQNGVAFTATVSSGAGTPTGTVTFLDGATPLGTGTLSGGMATFATSSLAAGSHTITATYGGDTNFLAASSIPLTQQVEDFGFTVSSQTVTVRPGGTAVFTFTVSPIDGTTFPAAITFTASGLPADATYTFSPASVTAGEGSTTVTLTIDVSQTQAGINPVNLHPNIQRTMNNAGDSAGLRGKPNHSVARGLAPFALALILLPFAGRLRRAGRRLSRMLSMLLLLVAGMAAAAGISGCGSTSGFFVQEQQSYTVTVTGTSGALTHSATVTLTVQ